MSKNRPWTPEEDAQLLADLKRELCILQMAENYGRSCTSIEIRLASFAAMKVHETEMDLLEACSTYRVSETMVMRALNAYNKVIRGDSVKITVLEKSIATMQESISDFDVLVKEEFSEIKEQVGFLQEHAVTKEQIVELKKENAELKKQIHALEVKLVPLLELLR